MLASKVNASSFCRRRLSVIVMRSKMAETMKAAVTFVEQGHVRVGPDIIRDPAYLVTRFVTDLNLLSYVKFNSKLLFLRCRKLSQRFFVPVLYYFEGFTEIICKQAAACYKIYENFPGYELRLSEYI